MTIDDLVRLLGPAHGEGDRIAARDRCVVIRLRTRPADHVVALFETIERVASCRIEWIVDPAAPRRCSCESPYAAATARRSAIRRARREAA